MKKYILSIIVLFATLNCNSQPKTINIDFLKYVTRYMPDTTGEITCGPLCKENGTIIGIFEGYLIHSNGGSWWYNQAKKRFPKDRGSRNKYLSHYSVAERLLRDDRDSLKNYNKWVFFTDMKYLYKSNYLHGETGKEIESVQYLKDKPFEIVLYQQLAGETKWLEIERRIFDNKKKQSKIKWESNFIKERLAESNLPR